MDDKPDIPELETLHCAPKKLKNIYKVVISPWMTFLMPNEFIRYFLTETGQLDEEPKDPWQADDDDEEWTGMTISHSNRNTNERIEHQDTPADLAICPLCQGQFPF